MCRRLVSRMGPRLAGRAAAVRAALAATAAVERALPSTPPIERAISKSGADLVLVSPFVSRPGYQTDYVKSARRLGLPTGLLVASWDNLSSKGRIRTLPDAVLVWNEAQRDEAVALHGVPPSRVVLTGAQPFDRWFDRSPTSTAAEFKREVGLPVDREFVLFVGSTRQELDETAERRYVEAWSEALRRSDDPGGARSRRARAPASDDGRPLGVGGRGARRSRRRGRVAPRARPAGSGRRP